MPGARVEQILQRANRPALSRLRATLALPPALGPGMRQDVVCDDAAQAVTVDDDACIPVLGVWVYLHL